MKTIKWHFYALLGLFLFGILGSSQAQDVIPKIEVENGISIKPGGNTFPARKGFSTYLAPLIADSTMIFYYDLKDRRIIIDFSKFGGAGLAYTPGIGLTLTNREFGIKQWPAGDLGNIGVKNLFWSEGTVLYPANVLSLSNARFLMTVGNSTVAMSMGDFQAFLSLRYNLEGGGLGTQKGWRRVAPVKNHLEPGEEGDYFWYQARFHWNIEKAAGQNAWLRIQPDSTFDYGVLPPASVPAPVLQLRSVAIGSLTMDWIYTSPVDAFRLYASKSDTLHYQAVTPDLAAGLRSYAYTNVPANTKYFFKLQALTPQGPSPLSNAISGTTPDNQFSQYAQLQNLTIVQAGPNSFKVDFDVTQPGGAARFEISTKTNPAVNADDDWVYTNQVGGETLEVGHYTYTLTGINDPNVRRFRYRMQSLFGEKLPSNWDRSEPFSIQNGGITVNTPVITGVSNVTNSSITLGLNFNNSTINRAFLYIAEWKASSGQITYDRVAILTTANTYQFTNLKAGTKYLFHLQVSKMDGSNEIYSSNSTPETEATTLGSSSTQLGPLFTNFSFVANSSTSDYDNQFGTAQQFKYSYLPVQAYTNYSMEGDIRINNGPWTEGIRSSGGYNASVGKGYGSMGLSHNSTAAQPGNVVRQRIRIAMFNSSSGPIVRSPWSQNILKTTYGPGFATNPNDRSWELEAVSDQTPTGEAPPTTQPVQLQLSNTSATATTITVTNAVLGIKYYSWAVYQGVFNAGGIWKGCAGSNIPSEGSFTVDLASCGLTPGVTYRMYVTETNNADAKRNYVEFTIPATPAPANQTFRTSSYISN